MTFRLTARDEYGVQHKVYEQKEPAAPAANLFTDEYGHGHDITKVYTAWELACDWWWEEDFLARKLHGRVLWEEVIHNDTTQHSDHVRLGRIEGASGLKTFYTFVDPEQPMVLVRINAEARS